MRWRVWIVYAVFFGSGFAAIVYQVTWQRMLGLFTGSDVVSSALVVSAFLAGLGLGALVGGAYVDRLRRAQAVALFALCNLAIAAFALLSEWLFYDFLFQRFHAVDNRAVVFGLSFASMLVPTLIMGLSLPLLSRALVADITLAARTVGYLYAVDVFGAAAGAACTAWILLGTFGIAGSVTVGAAISLLVALGAAAAARGWDLPEPYSEIASPARRDAAHAELFKWGLLFFVSGFIAIALEIVWLRLFAVLYKSTFFTFGHVLAVFLFGDAVGLIAAARLVPRLRRPALAFYLIQVAVCAYAVASIWLLYALAADPGLAALIERWPDRGAAAGEHMFFLVVLPLALMAVPAVLLGASFPVVQKAVQKDLAQVGRAVGVIYLMNVLGNTLGGVITGLVLFEFVGFVPTLQILTAGAGVFLLFTVIHASDRPSVRLLGSVASVVAAAVVLIGLPGNADFWARMSGANASTAWLAGGTVTHHAVEENASGVSLVYGDERQAQVIIGGRIQGGVPFWRIHRHLGVVGPVLHRDPRRVLVIGFGSGGSPYFAGIHPRTESVHVVEIVDSVFDAHRRYAELTGLAPIRGLLRDPRYRFVYDDGRRFLARTQGRYDIIEVDAIVPSTARSGMLYSREFFELVRDRLTVGGLAVQWRATDRVEATFRAVFEHGATWGNVLVGSNAPIAVDPQRIGSFLSNAEVADYGARGGLGEAERRALTGGRPWQSWQRTPLEQVAPSSINTDLNPRDEIPSVLDLMGGGAKG